MLRLAPEVHRKVVGHCYDGLPAGVLAQDGRQADLDGHAVLQGKVDSGGRVYLPSRTTGSSAMFPSTMRNERTTGRSFSETTT